MNKFGRRSEAGTATVFALLIAAVALAMASMIGQNVIELAEKTLPKESVAAYVAQKGSTAEIVNPSRAAADLSRLRVVVNGEEIPLKDGDGDGLWEPGEKLTVDFSSVSGDVVVLEVFYDGRAIYKAVYIKPLPLHSDRAYPTITYSGSVNYHVRVEDDTAVAAVKVYAGTEGGETLVNSFTPFRDVSRIKDCFEEYKRHGKWMCSEFSETTFGIVLSRDENRSRLHVHGKERTYNGTVNYLRIVAYDVSGKPTSVVLVSDSPPSVEIVQPKDGEVFVTTSKARIHIAARASDDFGVSKIEILLDGAEVAECRGKTCSAYADVSAGEHEIRAVAVDVSGQTASTSAAFTVVLDEKPAVKILQPEDGDVFWTTEESAEVMVKVSASDDRGVQRVEFYVDGELAGENSEVPYGLTVTLSAGRHEIRAVAVDTAGQRAEDSVAVIVKIDRPPTVRIVQPRDGQTFWTAEEVRVSVSASAEDDRGVERVEFYVDGRLVCTDAREPYACSVSLEPGRRTISAVAVDTAGQTASDSVTVTVRRDAPPSVAITKPEDGAVYWTAGDGFRVNVEVSAGDDRGLQRVEFYVDGEKIGSDFSAPYGISAELKTGEHEIRAVAVDTAGQTASDSVRVTVKRDEAPLVTLLAPSSVSAHGSAGVTVRVSASDDRGLSRVVLKLDGRAVRQWSVAAASFSESVTLMLKPGRHAVRAEAFDTAGQTSAAEKIVDVIFVNAPPALSAPAEVTGHVGKTVTFLVTASDPDGDGVTVKALNLPKGASFDGRIFSWVPDREGPYTVTFVATDEYGASSSARTTIKVLPSGSVEIVRIDAPEIGWSRDVREVNSVVVGG